MKMKRIRIEDRPAADRRHCLPPLALCEATTSNYSLVPNAHCRKKRSFCRDNQADQFMGSSASEPKITTSFKKSHHSSQITYPYVPIPDDVCSLASSVDSCGDRMCDTDRDALSSDADSPTQLRSKTSSCKLLLRWRGVRPEARIPHRTEMKSYRRILEEFYGHGPLSWEQQEYLADLRSMLHVSNDEHLREVKKLICLSSDLNSLSVC